MDIHAFQQKLRLAAEKGELLFMNCDEAGLKRLEPPEAGTVVALAPHPDDPESVALSLKLFAEAGCSVHYIIVCLSPAGVQDSYALTHAKENNQLSVEDLTLYKRELRREEQLQSARLAGFLAAPCKFLNMEEDLTGHLIESPHNARMIEEALDECDPDIAIMPYGEDTNSDHVLVYRYFRQSAAKLAARKGKPILALYNRDPKTVEITEQLAVPFTVREADWKARLLRVHRSQHERNLKQRGHGFDDRILRTNSLAWRILKERAPEPWMDKYPYAETFQVELITPS